MRLQYSKVFIRVLTLLFVSFVFAGASHAAGPINVSGNVLDKQTPPHPISNFNVGLYPNEQREGGQLSNGTTLGEGVYNMYADNVGEKVTEVWVTSEMRYSKAHPVYVDLRPNRKASIASDALRVEWQGAALSSNEPNRAADYAAAAFETRGIQSYTGAMTKSDAQQQAFFDTYPLIATQKLTGNSKRFWDAVLESFQEPIKRNEILWHEVRDIYESVRSMESGETSVQSTGDANLASLRTPPQKSKVALTIPSLELDLFNQIEKSADAEAKAKGVNLVVADANGHSSIQVEQIKDMIFHGVNAVICIPVDLASVGDELRAAKKANIYVINVEREALDAPGDTFIATDEVGAAKTLGEYVCKVTGGKANIGVIQGQLGTKSEMDRDKGFTEAIANCPGLRVVAKRRAGGQDEGLAIAEAMLQGVPDINAFFGQADSLALGAAHAVKVAHIDNKVWIFGFDGDIAGLQAVRAGTLDATMTQKTQYIGKLAVDSALDLIDGKHLPKEQLQEAVLTTKENVDFFLHKHP